MIYNNPFLGLADLVSPFAMKGFVIAMIALVITGTLLDIIHKKNVKYFFITQKKQKKMQRFNLLQAKKLQLY